MAHPRTQSISEPRNAHSVSLKVLRLSRPSLSHQYPLPLDLGARKGDGSLRISPLAGLAAPPASSNAEPDNEVEFTITPALTLPSSFASAYVGESFACTLSANNELAPDADKSISNVRVAAEMQSPSNPSGASLNVEPGSGDFVEGLTEGIEELAPGGSLQSIIRLDLKEEGPHILAVTVTYTETQVASGAGHKGDDGRRSPAVVGARVRTFRKLYQFVAQQLLSVRTKTGRLGGQKQSEKMEKFVLEAQLENMGEGTVCLEQVTINAEEAFELTSLNWDLPVPVLGGKGLAPGRAPLLSPRDVVQVAFLLQRKKDPQRAVGTTKDGKTALGQLHIQWRGHMGDRGSLSTGTLSAKARTEVKPGG